mmetsp:Transcript_28858/g.38478  ORF Transcript_28858/g.38478 Transcript_28858/m.38478 type:complete len:166 (-) Transcript_28858:1268-1765(-)
MFDFAETPSFSQSFEDAEIGGSNFIINIGPMFGFVVVYPLWLLIKAMARYLFDGHCENKRCFNLFMTSSDPMPVFMTFMLESCVEIGLASIISIKLMNEDRFSTAMEVVSTTLAYFFAVMLVVSPIYLIISGCRLYYAKKRHDKEEVALYAPLFEEKRIKSIYAI